MILLRLRQGWVAACVMSSAVAGCGVGASSTIPDGAVIQVMQDSRERVRSEPGTHQAETLSLTNAAQMAAQKDGDRNIIANLEVTAPSTPSVGATAEDRIKALTLAQNAELRMAQGDLEGAREALDASMAHYPTLEALGLVAPMLALDGDDATLESHCKQTLGAMIEDEARLTVLDVCAQNHSAKAPEKALAWAEPDVIVWYLEARRSRR